MMLMSLAEAMLSDSVCEGSVAAPAESVRTILVASWQCLSLGHSRVILQLLGGFIRELLLLRPTPRWPLASG